MASIKIGLKDKKKVQDAVMSSHKTFFLVKKLNNLYNAKKRNCLSFFPLKTFELHFWPGDNASPVRNTANIKSSRLVLGRR